MAAHVAEAEDDPYEPVGPPADAGSDPGERAGPEPGQGVLDTARAGVGMVPVVGTAGVLVLLMSAASVEGLRRVAQAWTGPVLVVGSAEEAREVIGTDGDAAPVDTTPPPARATAATITEGGRGHGTEGGGDARGIRLDADRQVVSHRGAEAPLTPLEFGLLSALLHRPGRVRRFEQLTEEVWGTRHVGDAAPVHSVVKRLRRKLDRLGAPVQLQAVRGIGFRLAERPTLSVVDP